jgi:hypothetical protein
MTTNAMIFGTDFKIGAKLSASHSPKIGMACDTYRPSGVSTTLQHHSSDPYGGYSRVWRQLIWFHDNKCHDVWPRVAI